MKKETADEIIAEYTQKIFGFALSKTYDTYKAEELASRITLDVYISLLKAEDIQNIASYIYRVSCNVYARFIDEEKRGTHISLDEAGGAQLQSGNFVDDLTHEETLNELRREIAFLSKLQREIIILHYFQNLKQSEIAERLNIPLGTVKWHLHDARKTLKEGMNMKREKGALGMNPVKLWMGYSGMPSPTWQDPSHYLKKSIAQNIVYAAYHEAKTITEIAEELGVSAAFIEDEIFYLEELSFIDKVAGNKYLTNIFIRESSKETAEYRHELNKKYSKIIREKYIPLVFDAMKDYKLKKIYTPQDDFNFLIWSAIAYSCRYNLYYSKEDMDTSKYYVKRKDGSNYIALGYVENTFKVSYDKEKYNVPNNMTRSSEHTSSWQLNSYYDTRGNDPNDNRTEDYEYLYEFITGKLTKDAGNAQKFKHLFDIGYLVAKDNSEYVNIVVTTNSENDVKSLLPAMPDELKTSSEEFDREVYNLQKSQYPAHMQDLYKAWCTGCMSNQDLVAYVVELLLDDGTLKPLTDVQKHSVNTILFCDVLPK